MLQIAPSFVPRRQLRPSTTGTKKKLAMNLACSITIAWTSPSCSVANQNGITPSTTIDSAVDPRPAGAAMAAGLTSRL